MEGQKFHTVQRVQVPKKRIQNAATCMGRGILMVSQPNLIQTNTSVDTMAATTQACCPNRLQVLMIESNRLNNNVHILNPAFHYDKGKSIKVVRLGPPQHKHKHISIRSTENCCLLGSIPPRYSKTRWNKILYLAAARSHLTYAQTQEEENVLFFFCLCLCFARPHHLCSALRAGLSVEK